MTFAPIAITATGCLTAQGLSTAATWAGILAATDRLAPWADAPANLAHLKVAHCGELPRPADLPAYFWNRLSRTQQLGTLAIAEALAAAGLPQKLYARGDRAGLFLATTTCGMDRTEQFYEQFRLDQFRREQFTSNDNPLRETLPDGRVSDQSADPTLLRRVLAPETLAFLARRHGICGPRLLCLTTCVGSAVAISAACDALHAGRIDVAVAGGTEAMCRVVLSGFHALKLVAPDGCRPFDKNRPGITVGEGAGMLVLERLPDAQARGAKILALIRGTAATCDAHHLTAPEPTGTQARRAIAQALAMAHLAPNQIDYINAHGTGTRENDATEAHVLRTAFAPALPPISSTKRLTGHTFGAAAAIETILTALALREGILPSNAGTQDPEDPAFPLVKSARPATLTHALTCNFAFGGNNTAIVLGTPDAYA